MAKKQQIDLKKFGHYAFIAGILIAIIVALVPTLRGDIAVWLMVVLGLVVGLLNVTAKEVTGFLIAAMALIIASSASALSLAVIWTFRVIALVYPGAAVRFLIVFPVLGHRGADGNAIALAHHFLPTLSAILTMTA